MKSDSIRAARSPPPESSTTRSYAGTSSGMCVRTMRALVAYEARAASPSFRNHSR